MQDDRERLLQDLLQNSCTVAEMRAFVRRLPGELEHHLPEGPASPAEFAGEMIHLLARHNALDAEFFTGLIALRPKRRAEIIAVASSYGMTDLADTAPRQPRLLGNTPPAPCAQSILSGYKRKAGLILGAVGAFIVIPGLVVYRPDSVPHTLAPLAGGAPSPPREAAAASSGATGPVNAGTDGTSTSLSREPETSGSVRATALESSPAPPATVVASEPGITAEAAQERMVRESCAALRARTKATVSRCTTREGLTTDEASVDVTVSSGGRKVSITPRNGRRYPDYLQCIENAIKFAAKDTKREHSIDFECKLAP